MAKTFRVGLVGYKFMGRAHSNAWRQAPKFFDLKANIEMHTICGRDAAGVQAARAIAGGGVTPCHTPPSAPAPSGLRHERMSAIDPKPTSAAAPKSQIVACICVARSAPGCRVRPG